MGIELRNVGTGRTITVHTDAEAAVYAKSGWGRVDDAGTAPPDDVNTVELPATADGLITWIGDDRDRAAYALAAEEQRDKPRKTVLDHINALTGNDPQEP
jgi:hypothetical protein